MTTRWRDDVADTFANSRLAADGWLTAAAPNHHRWQLSDGKGGDPAAVVRVRAGTLVSGIL
jgi:hypothetical protein